MFPTNSTYFKDVAVFRQNAGLPTYPANHDPVLGSDPVEEVRELVGSVVNIMARCHACGLNFDALWQELVTSHAQKVDQDWRKVLIKMGMVLPMPEPQKCEQCQKEVDQRTSILGKLICHKCLSELRETLR